MPDQILYTGGPNPFKGLIGMPEKPFPDQSEDGYHQKYEAYRKQVESIKSNAPDIVNIEALGLSIMYFKEYCKWITEMGELHICKPGDIFNLPVGYEFKKEDVPLGDVQHSIKDFRTALRIVKTEVKETKKAVYVKGYYNSDDLRKLAADLDLESK